MEHSYLFAEIYSSSIIIGSMRAFATLADAEGYARSDFGMLKNRGWRGSARRFWYNRRLYQVSGNDSPELVPLKERVAMLDGIK